MYYLYAIGIESALTPPYNGCYIGVTKDLDRRWSSHMKSAYTIGHFIRKHHLVQSKHMIIIFKGTEEECFDLEALYRPSPMMGLNEAIGGHGGYTTYTEERNLKISQALKGKPKKKEHVKKMQKTLIEKGVRKGAKNPRAKKWMLTSPTGVVYNIHGNLTETCKTFNLLESALRHNKNLKVPEPNLNGYGGYRAKSKESLKMRLNTTGWCLKEVAQAQEV
jgi:hypothetical protein